MCVCVSTEVIILVCVRYFRKWDQFLLILGQNLEQLFSQMVVTFKGSRNRRKIFYLCNNIGLRCNRILTNRITRRTLPGVQLPGL